MEVNKVYLGDSNELIKKIDSNSIDLLCTDPPYGLEISPDKWDDAVPSQEFFSECLRVLKDGAFAFIFSGARLDILVAMYNNIKNAGFDTNFTPIFWVKDNAFPKGVNIGKKTNNNFYDGAYGGYQPRSIIEIIIVVMKPINKTFVRQALTNNKGITWLGKCKINNKFPANLLIENNLHPDYCIYNFIINSSYKYNKDFSLFPLLFVSRPSTKEKEMFLDLPKQKKHKTVTSEKCIFENPNIFQRNIHPTVKPLKLMQYLITLGSVEKDIVLDPFAGSGTTLLAAQSLNRYFIGFEKQQEYFQIIENKLKNFYQNLFI